VVGVGVRVPHELAARLRDLDLRVVVVADDPRLVGLVERGQRGGEIDLVLHQETSKTMPWASGRSFEKFTVAVCRRMYAFQASEPDSRPPPVSFSPPNAPPISAPLGPMLTLAMPQSEPVAARNRSASRRSVVKIDEASPWGTPFWSATASSSS